jgi:hypothetical protein
MTGEQTAALLHELDHIIDRDPCRSRRGSAKKRCLPPINAPRCSNRGTRPRHGDKANGSESTLSAGASRLRTASSSRCRARHRRSVPDQRPARNQRRAARPGRRRPRNRHTTSRARRSADNNRGTGMMPAHRRAPLQGGAPWVSAPFFRARSRIRRTCVVFHSCSPAGVSMPRAVSARARSLKVVQPALRAASM